MTSLKKTILFCPMNGWGHINACLGLAQELLSRGHRVVWAMNIAFQGKVTRFGFEEEITGKNVEQNAEVKEYWPQFMEKNHKYLTGDTLTMAKEFALKAYWVMLEDAKQQDDEYKEILDKVKPDLIVIDTYLVWPTLTLSGIPWVWLYSAAPQWLFTSGGKIPPYCSGLPQNADRKEWNDFLKAFRELIEPLYKQSNDYYKSRGGDDLPDLLLHPFSPYLNIYFYPKELDYEEVHPLPSNFIRVENFLRLTDDKFEIPEKLAQRPGKLVLFSMGTFGCANLELMTRLTKFLSKSQHKFIVSKGALFANHELPENMWGQQSLPQTAIIPLVDLIITHGGNNTVTEAFYFGKPMLVCPLFGDQYDNAQRIAETGLGLRLNPFHCTEQELVTAVDRLVNDEQLATRMAQIGQRVRSSKDKQIVADKIEKLAK